MCKPEFLDPLLYSKKEVEIIDFKVCHYIVNGYLFSLSIPELDFKQCYLWQETFFKIKSALCRFQKCNKIFFSIFDMTPGKRNSEAGRTLLSEIRQIHISIMETLDVTTDTSIWLSFFIGIQLCCQNNNRNNIQKVVFFGDVTVTSLWRQIWKTLFWFFSLIPAFQKCIICYGLV